MILTFDRSHRITLSGTTAAARPELAGLVLEDRLRPFAASGTGAPPVSGVLQERVVRSSVDNTLAFYYRIKELTGGVIRTQIALGSWPIGPIGLPAVDMDYRLDGLGDVGPATANCLITPFLFEFSTGRAVTPAELSRFMFVKMIPGKGYPNVMEYNHDGQITIQDEAWAVTLPESFCPVIP